MLGKLIKYEFRSTAMFFLPIYAALVIISALTAALYRLAESFNSDFFNFSLAASVSLYVLLALGLAVTTFVIIIIRFYKNLLGNEGYLMFTLPVTAEQNILAKLIPAAVWFVGSCVLGLLTIIPVLNFRYDDFSFTFEHITTTHVAATVLFVIMGLASLLTGFLFLYLCMCIGQTFNSHRFLASAVTMITLQSAAQIISIMLIALLSSGAGESVLSALISVFVTSEGELSNSGLLVMLGGIDVFIIAVGGLLFWADSTILRKKLNLV